jgi:hypothetical protein
MANDSLISLQDGECEEITEKRLTGERLSFSWERFPFSRTDTIFVEFPDMYGDGYSGMRIGDISSQPTLVKHMDVCDSLRTNDLVQRTSHPNLVNLTGMSRTRNKVFFSYERSGASLAKLHAFIRGDAVAVATICEKVRNTQALRL